jgi:peptide/nickel transport system substrate-binding protein
MPIGDLTRRPGRETTVKKDHRTTAVIGLTTLVMTGAMSPASALDAPKRGGVLTFAVSSELSTYDCDAADGYPTLHVVAPHYSTLLRIDATQYPQIEGDVAQSWEVSDNDRTFTFHLRPNIHFHDGSGLTAKDVKASLDRIRNPPPGVVSVRQAQFAEVTSVEAPDDLTLIVRSAQPDASLLTIFASPWNCIYSARLLKENPDYPVKIVMGSGPFRFVDHVAGSRWVGRRFEQYFRPGLPYLDGFEAYFIARPALTTALEGGQVMAEFVGVSPAERESLSRSMGSRIKFEDNIRLSNFQLTFNTQRKPFDDIRVRRALVMAIDHWAVQPLLRKSTVGGLNGGLLPPSSVMARTEQQFDTLLGFSHSPAETRAEARELLQEAGQEQLKVTLVNVSNPNPWIAIGIYVLDQWRQLGLTVDQMTLPAPQWFAARSSGDFDVVVDFVGEYADDPTLWLAHYLSYDRAPANLSRAIDRTLDDLFEQQRHSTDATARAALVHAFEERVVNQAYVAPITWSYRIIPLAPEVMGYVVTPSIHVNQDLATVWLNRE